MNIQDIIGNLETQLTALEEMDSIPPEKKVDAMGSISQAIDSLVDLSDSGYGYDEDRDDFYGDNDE